MELTVTRNIAASPDRVFEVFADLPRAAGRVRGIKAVQILTAGPVGLGTRWKETRTVFGRDSTEEMAITAFDPPRGYTVEAESCGTHFRTEFRFTPAPNGTAVEMRFACEGKSLFAKVMAPLGKIMSKGMVKMIEADLDDLAKACEAR